VTGCLGQARPDKTPSISYMEGVLFYLPGIILMPAGHKRLRESVQPHELTIISAGRSGALSRRMIARRRLLTPITLSLFHRGYVSRKTAVRGWPGRAGQQPRVAGPGPPESGLAPAERELSVPGPRWARTVPAVARPPSVTGRWQAADSLDSHLGGGRTLILPGRIRPATRESAWQKSASGSSHGGPACR
jgi:hypothetical protein